MQERIKEHDKDIRLTWNQTITGFEHTHETSHYPIWNEDKFIIEIFTDTQIESRKLFT